MTNKFRMIHQVDQAGAADLFNRYRPVFILSPGRSGSKFIAELLNLSPALSAFHEPRPALQYCANFAFLHRGETPLLAKMIEAARFELMLDTFIKGRTYVESNQCLTFFAPAIAGLFRGAKFVRLTRHPGDFVASAARKGWYRNDTIWEAGRPKPADEKRWESWSQTEKLAWLWDTTTASSRNSSPHWQPSEP